MALTDCEEFLDVDGLGDLIGRIYSDIGEKWGELSGLGRGGYPEGGRSEAGDGVDECGCELHFKWVKAAIGWLDIPVVRRVMCWTEFLH